MFAAGAAGLLAGCSDASRFADPFTNPFQDSAPVGRVDRAPTGTNPVRRSVVEQRPLAPPQAVSQSAPAAAPAPIAAAPAPAPARAAGAYNHWSAEGGTPVVVAEGESAGVIATRYGVPVDALLRVNGFGKAAEVHPGSRLVIPIYRASVASAAAAPVAAPAPVHAAVQPKMQPQPAAKGADVRDRKTERAAAPVESKNPVESRKLVEPKKKTSMAEPEPAPTPVRQAVAERPHPAPVKQAQAPVQIEAKQAKPAPKQAEAQPVKSAPRQIAQAPVQAKPAPAPKQAEAHPARAQLAQRTKEPEPVKAKPAEPQRKLAQAEPARKPEPEVRAEKSAKKKPEPAPAKEIARAAPQVEKPQRFAEAAPAPQPQAQRNIDKTPTASIPPQQAEEKPSPASTQASADARPEFRWPARGRIIQGFNSGGNDGINISVPEGTQVKAAEGGVVAYAGSELKGYGNLVLIRHPNGFVSAYAHNGELDVKRGDQVKRGQTIAKSGQSGNVGSPQLHFELRKGSTPVDPTGYLAGL
ncbi:peptidoglycan DD-metalloendopeptidase family protein [Methylosinus sp. H3A]|uniref:LysM peptidoglycan-binding domain-containing M23 family metallopeptidase n=1 Tax=Methylosinus sp. H3A TaxID=2785786 RepID=UPI0018C2B8C6|nr:peptidoglycan DD-metalloendopeptidase family protein [Methylosinus sp. H3A]MBG0811525.1 peptidoglycan DD-metalloendopeptidase family protein [Methylosinus sp. H3A]